MPTCITELSSATIFTHSELLRFTVTSSLTCCLFMQFIIMYYHFVMLPVCFSTSALDYAMCFFLAFNKGAMAIQTCAMTKDTVNQCVQHRTFHAVKPKPSKPYLWLSMPAMESIIFKQTFPIGLLIPCDGIKF